MEEEDAKAEGIFSIGYPFLLMVEAVKWKGAETVFSLENIKDNSLKNEE